jgi:uroporphyrinogen-III decarboxylase
MDFFHERIHNYLEHLLQKGAVTMYRICGPEYATPPYLNPREFDKLVKSYDVNLVNLLHRYRGYARLHSHGKVKRVLPIIKEMEVDAIDPMEPPPDGDVELHEARKILGTRTVLIGNIEERLFEIGHKTDIEKQVKKAISQAATTGEFILCPTAMPISTPLRRKIQQNIIHYIDCSLKYGQLDKL